MKDIRITNKLTIPARNFSVNYTASGGPGGQNVNRVNTKVQLRWHLQECESLSEEKKQKIQEQACSYLTKDGEILISSTRSRHQQGNFHDCIEKLRDLIKTALRPKKKRKKTKVPRYVHKKRLENKRHKGRKKQLRAKVEY